MRSSSLVARRSPSFNRIDDGRHGRSAGQGNVVPLPPAPGGKQKPSRESQRGLDWFIFFLADVQTGFGPFVAVYLTTQKWTQVEIGFVLSIGGIIGLLGQMPGGAIVDAARSERLGGGPAGGTIGIARVGRGGGAILRGGGPCGGNYRYGRVGLCGVANFPGRGCGRDLACAGKLRARSCDCCDQSRPGWSACDRRAAWPQRPVRLARQRLGGSPDGRMRL